MSLGTMWATEGCPTLTTACLAGATLSSMGPAHCTDGETEGQRRAGLDLGLRPALSTSLYVGSCLNQLSVRVETIHQ